jgi:hypothetical protein
MSDRHCGTVRRLQALTAIGWDAETLAHHLGWNTHHLTRALNGHPPPHTHHTITQLYDQLSMTPGGNPQAQQHAAKHRWPPPLAWDDDDLDNPTATPAPNWRRQTRQTFRDRYHEWRHLGYTDLEITHRFNVRPDTLATMLYRAGLPVSPQLAEASHEQKTRKRVNA